MDCKIIVYCTNSANKKRATLISDFDSFLEMIRKKLQRTNRCPVPEMYLCFHID